MAKVVAIIGSYRRGGIIDQAVEAVVDSLRSRGHEVEKIFLLDKQISFCTNCRACTQDAAQKMRGRCAQTDDMEQILEKIDRAEVLVLASPVNFGTVSAVMKVFIERLIAYTYWPWGKLAPKNRILDREKKAVAIVSCSCPAFLVRLLMPNALSLLKTCANLVGAELVQTLCFGGVCKRSNQELSSRQLRKAELAGKALIGG